MELSKESSQKIQVLRGLAIIAVVLIHNTPEGPAQIWCRPFLNFCVGTFLFLSGMLSHAEQWHPWKRIKKILIPYIIWTLIYVIIKNYRTPAQIPVLYLKNLITSKAATTLYYVFVYCGLTLIIPLIDRLARSRFKLLGFAVSPLEIILMRLIPLLSGRTFSNYIEIVMRISFLGWFNYFYLGYLLGNRLLEIKMPSKKLALLWAASIMLQILEGYLYFSRGESNCGTQLKLSCILSGMIFVILAYRYIHSQATAKNTGILRLLGDCSFGIFFSHLAIMKVLDHVPYYSKYVFYPLNGLITILLSLAFVLIGKKLLGRWSKYLALA